MGPRLLKPEEIELLPTNSHWNLYGTVTGEIGEQTFLTVRYTSSNNPHWGNIHADPAPFDSLERRYWHSEENATSVGPTRTVNFLLKRI